MPGPNRWLPPLVVLLLALPPAGPRPLESSRNVRSGLPAKADPRDRGASLIERPLA